MAAVKTILRSYIRKEVKLMTKDGRSITGILADASSYEVAVASDGDAFIVPRTNISYVRAPRVQLSLNRFAERPP